MEVSRDNRSINKLPSVLPTTELEDNSKLCNLKEQRGVKGSPVAAVCWLWKSLGGTVALQSCREKRGSRCSSSPDPHCAALLLVVWATKKMPHFFSLEKLIRYQKCSVNDGAVERD